MDRELERELRYHEQLYSGFAQQHFAKAAVRSLRAHMARRIVSALDLGPNSRVLSIGCGIGDTELLLARHVGSVTGVDLSPSAVRQANADAAAAGIANFRAVCAPMSAELAAQGRFDAVIAIFFLHHLSDSALREVPGTVATLLEPGGAFYALDPNRRRLSGWIGERLFPELMARYQSPGERPLDPDETARIFASRGYRASRHWYDFVSTPLAGLLPSWNRAYRSARLLDEILVRIPGLNLLSSNFEIVARLNAR